MQALPLWFAIVQFSLGLPVLTCLIRCIVLCRILLGQALLLFSLSGCGWFHSAVRSEIPIDERPRVAILPLGIEVEIKKLSSVKSIEDELPPEDEARLVGQAVQEIRDEARWLLLSKLATGQRFLFVTLAEVDAAGADLGLQPGQIPDPAKLAGLRTRLEADLVVVANIEGYGKVRWQWLLAGMLTDITTETVVVGLATNWNPAAVFGVVIGWDLLTSPPVWFGGGYLFGIAFRPVLVEARVFSTSNGEPVWQDQAVAIYARGILKELPEEQRSKKEVQLYVNLTKAMEELGDSLHSQEYTVTKLRERQ